MDDLSQYIANALIQDGHDERAAASATSGVKLFFLDRIRQLRAEKRHDDATWYNRMLNEIKLCHGHTGSLARAGTMSLSSSSRAATSAPSGTASLARWTCSGAITASARCAPGTSRAPMG